MGCPLSIVGFDGEMDGIPNTGFTVTSLFIEFVVDTVAAESDTNMQ